VSRPLVVGPLAEREVEAAARWYDEQAPGLGRDFIHEVLAAFDAIESAPELCPVLSEPYRRKLLERFPYAVIYKLTVKRVYVRAVAHCKRRPGYWDR
jgi:plasmid stabilization system protein ParE